jgi:hypothetical protein
MRPAALGKGIAAPPLAREKSNFLSVSDRRQPGTSKKWRNSREAMLASLIGKSHPAREFHRSVRVSSKAKISFLKP